MSASSEIDASPTFEINDFQTWLTGLMPITDLHSNLTSSPPLLTSYRLPNFQSSLILEPEQLLSLPSTDSSSSSEPLTTITSSHSGGNSATLLTIPPTVSSVSDGITFNRSSQRSRTVVSSSSKSSGGSSSAQPPEGDEDPKKDNENRNNDRKNIGKEWKSKIHGKAQKTGTEGHDWQSMREAVKSAKDPDVVRVHMDQTLSKVTEGKVTSRMRPDFAEVRKDGRITTNEVTSKSQKVEQMEKKIEKMQNLLPPAMRGPGKGGRVIEIKK
jgi:hypothetical protein